MNYIEFTERFIHLQTAFVQANIEIFSPLARLERLVSSEEEIEE